MDPTVHYNIYNTAVYAILLGISVFYLALPALDRLDIDIDRKFFYAVTPFVLLGAALRSLRDIEVIDTILLETPIIYVLMFCLVGGVLMISLYLERISGKDYWKPMALIGGLMLLFALMQLPVSNPSAILEVGALIAVTGGGFYLLTSYVKPEFASPGFIIPVITHYFDASTTVVALSYGAEEKHVLANFFLDIMGYPGMFVMKSLIIIPATYYIYTESEGENKNFLLFVIALLGLALGARNLISTVTG